jgi:cis-L-3-hydroxyproline dehydratase
MKITRVAIHQVNLPVVEGSYAWADQAHQAFDSTVVRIDTDEGVTGWGETCPLGLTYLAAFAEVRTPASPGWPVTSLASTRPARM